MYTERCTSGLKQIKKKAVSEKGQKQKSEKKKEKKKKLKRVVHNKLKTSPVFGVLQWNETWNVRKWKAVASGGVADISVRGVQLLYIHSRL